MLKYKKKYGYLSIGDRIGAVVDWLGMDKSVQLAGRSEKQIKRYIKGDEAPVGVVKALADASGVSVSWLIDGEISTSVDAELDLQFLSFELQDLREWMKEEASDVKELQEAKELENLLLKMMAASEELMVTLEKHGPLKNARRSIPPSPKFVDIPRYSVEASAGNGAIVLDEEIVDHFSVSREILDRIGVPVAKLGVIQARGDSMVPLINEGDYLVISFAIDRTHVDAGGIFVISYAGSLFVKRLQIMMDGSIQIKSDNPAYDPERVSAEEADDAIKVHAKVVWKLGPLRS